MAPLSQTLEPPGNPARFTEQCADPVAKIERILRSYQWSHPQKRPG
jgi:hypothetical protein